MELNNEWVLASGNKGKLKEFKDLFAPWGVNWVAQGELGVLDAEEPFHTFVENALTKGPSRKPIDQPACLG
jgi:XTP/dITP diphosphohydrolase